MYFSALSREFVCVLAIFWRKLTERGISDVGAWELLRKLLGSTETTWKLLGYEGTLLLIGWKHPGPVSDWPETTEKTTGKGINTEPYPC